MKTNNFITTIITLGLALFISIASIANSYSKLTGEGIKPTDKNQPASVKSSNCEPASSVSVEKEFSYLRFDVNNYNSETEIDELPVKSLIYLRFDVSNFTDSNESEINELPSASEFDYLRFDVTSFTQNNVSDLNEMPENEFEYLRFNPSRFTDTNMSEVVELPVSEESSSI